MRLRRSIIAVSIVAASLVGLAAAPVQSANLLCPQLCLTTGTLKLGPVARASVAASETRTYRFDFDALDLTEAAPVQESLRITLEATGTVKNGIFTGTGGMAYIEPYPYGNSAYIGNIKVTETPLTISASGSQGNEQFQLYSTILGGGTALYKSTYDHDWDYCNEC